MVLGRKRGSQVGLKVFIAHAANDEALALVFRNLLIKQIFDRSLSESIVLTSMANFPPGRPSAKSNRLAIAENDVFLLLYSPAFESSDFISTYELPAIIAQATEGREVIPIPLCEADPPYGDSFLRIHQFFKPHNTVIKNFGDEPREMTDLDLTSQRNMFVGQLMEQLIVILRTRQLPDPTDRSPRGGQGDTRDEYLQKIKIVEDFLRNREGRPLRACRYNDLVVTAWAQMRIHPEIRHLLVLDERDGLIGLLSQRDVLKINFRAHLSQHDNLVELDNEVRTARVGSFMTSRAKLVCMCLDTNPRLSDAIHELIVQRANKKRISSLIILRSQGSFERGNYNIVTYVDILKAIADLPSFRDLRIRLTTTMNKQDRISSVRDSDPLSIAYALTREYRTIPVLDDKDEFVGLLTDTDILYQMAGDTLEAPIRDFMRARQYLPTIDAAQTVEQVIKTFLGNRDLSSLPLLDPNGKIDRMIGYIDVLKAAHDLLT